MSSLPSLILSGGENQRTDSHVESTSGHWGAGRGTLEAAMPSSGTCKNYMDIINSRMMFGFAYECNYWKISTKLLYVHTKDKNVPWNKLVLTDLTIEVKFRAEISVKHLFFPKAKSFHHFETLRIFV